jgi:translation elongation factor EF-Tu-like GTPase
MMDEERRKLLELPFSMMIEDVFVIKKRGICITGRAKTGMLHKVDKFIWSVKGST